MSRLELALKDNRLSKIIHLYLKEHVYFLQSTFNLQIAFICIKRCSREQLSQSVYQYVSDSYSIHSSLNKCHHCPFELHVILSNNIREAALLLVDLDRATMKLTINVYYREKTCLKT